VARAKKNAWQDIALLAHLIPGLINIPAFAPWDYEDFCGLWFCRQDLIALATWPSFLAAGYAHGKEDLPPILFQAAYDDESIAWHWMVEINNARIMARVREQRDREQKTGMVTESLFG